MKLLAILLLVSFISFCSAQTCGDNVCSLDFAENKVNCLDDCEGICPCRPYCEGRECGDDGCGGSCGTCPFPSECNEIGQCDCARNCIGKECGDDGCNRGEICDFCGPQQTCGFDFLCTGPCTPNCINPDGSRRECGNDGCFGSCGECTQVPGQDIRCRDGVCTCRPQCDLIECGSDGCGGDCGACEGDASCIDGFCVFPTLGCCGDGICDPTDGEDVCSCHTDCRGCCVNDICEELFGETEQNCIEDCVDSLLIEVRELQTDILISQAATISVSGPNGYSAELAYTPIAITWEFQDGGFGSYTFITASTGYIGMTATISVTLETTLITLYVELRPIEIEVRNGITLELISSATINANANFGNGGSESFGWVAPSMLWVPFAGYGSYTYLTTAAGYLPGDQTENVSLQTELITLFLFPDNLPFIVEDCATNEVLDSSEVVASSTSFVSFSATFTVTGSSTSFVHVGYGTYTFEVSSSGYETQTFTLLVDQSTTEVRVCLDRSAFCGDGVCNGDETANPNSPQRCGDCGRLRGVISLAVGQKDQLNNITISVWAHPTNPALFLRRGEAVPAPDFITLSDSKGFFSSQQLSFDAPAGSTAFGSYSRRFYFSLTGSFVDRTDGSEVEIQLLPLWWNYELTNLQYPGSGSLANTNNSPSLYFYMTPPFPTSDALVRVILSWGTLTAQPAVSIPDIDFVVAGPVNSNSIAVFGTGIVNFENKDLQSSTEILPFVKIVSDSAQSFGPEVIDFYGDTASGALDIGFSDSYAPGAAANVYEIWIDKPNSQPNEELIFTFLAETNAFTVFYRSNGVENDQLLFDALTGVEHAYGFYNGDQWNMVPADATLWHVVDISETGIIFEGFPDDPAAAGAKYGFDGSFFEAQKTISCGHTASRGASPAYCPTQLNYPQSAKK